MAESRYIRHNIVRVKHELLPSVVDFYKSVCGMDYKVQSVSSDNYPYCKNGKLHILSYKPRDPSYTSTGVCFVEEENFTATNYQHAGYWKIGLVLQDVDSAVQCLSKHVPVSTANQFVDVGYLTALQDPHSYNIELLQDTFQVNFKEMDGEKIGPLNQPYIPSLGQITIRCRNAEETCNFYTKVLGMKLVCTQVPGNRYPFTLYFFAYTTEKPPNEDVSAVENREWLYQKSFCQIEVQHKHNLPPNFNYKTHNREGSIKLGHVGISVHVSQEQIREIIAMDNDIIYVNETQNVVQLCDPDGYLIELSCE